MSILIIYVNINSWLWWLLLLNFFIVMIEGNTKHTYERGFLFVFREKDNINKWEFYDGLMCINW